jgi:hypothetical protein
MIGESFDSVVESLYFLFLIVLTKYHIFVGIALFLVVFENAFISIFQLLQAFGAVTIKLGISFATFTYTSIELSGLFVFSARDFSVDRPVLVLLGFLFHLFV